MPNRPPERKPKFKPRLVLVVSQSAQEYCFHIKQRAKLDTDYRHILLPRDVPTQEEINKQNYDKVFVEYTEGWHDTVIAKEIVIALRERLNF